MSHKGGVCSHRAPEYPDLQRHVAANPGVGTLHAAPLRQYPSAHATHAAAVACAMAWVVVPAGHAWHAPALPLEDNAYVPTVHGWHNCAEKFAENSPRLQASAMSGACVVESVRNPSGPTPPAAHTHASGCNANRHTHASRQKYKDTPPHLNTKQTDAHHCTANRMQDAPATNDEANTRLQNITSESYSASKTRRTSWHCPHRKNSSNGIRRIHHAITNSLRVYQ